MYDEEDDWIDIYYCYSCGFHNCECCSECGKPHRDCEGCECPECWVCNDKEELI